VLDLRGANRPTAEASLTDMLERSRFAKGKTVVIDLCNGQVAAEFWQVDRVAEAVGLERPATLGVAAPHLNARLVLIGDQEQFERAIDLPELGGHLAVAEIYDDIAF
jgi:hypothetical protein